MTAAFFYLPSTESKGAGLQALIIGPALVLVVLFWSRALFSLLRQSFLFKRQGASQGEAGSLLLSRLLALLVAIVLSSGGGLLLAVVVSQALELNTLSPAKIFSGGSSTPTGDANKLSEGEFKSEIRRLSDSIPAGTFLTFDGGKLVACPKPDYNAFGDCDSLDKTPPFDGLSSEPIAGYPEGAPPSARWVTEISYDYYPRSCKAFIFQDKSGRVIKETATCDS